MGRHDTIGRVDQVGGGSTATRRAVTALLAAALLLALLPLTGPLPARASGATPGTWTPTGSMHTARANATATLLPNGKVLVAGGFACCGSNGTSFDISSAELYDPATGTWSATGSMHSARAGATATLLPNGKVLVAGGGPASAELYDPATGTWSATGSGGFGVGVELLGGKVFVAGGGGNGDPCVRTTFQVYDSTSATWSAPAQVGISGTVQAATLLPNGTVLVLTGGESICGDFRQVVSSHAAVYDPGTGRWTPTGPLHSFDNFGESPYEGYSVTLLPSGKVLLAFGDTGYGATGDAQLYDPATNTWAATGVGPGSVGHTATLLPNGTVLVAGGNNARVNGGPPQFLSGAALYDPARGTWSATGSMGTSRDGHTATLLPNGQVLVTGGQSGDESNFTTLSSAELYTPAPIAPATLFADGFEGGSFAHWSVVRTAADGSATVQTSVVRSGTYAARLAETATAGSLAYARAVFATPAHALTVAGDFLVAQEGTANANVPLIRLINTFGIRFVSVYRQNRDYDQVWIKDNAGYHRTGGALALHTWAHLTLRVVANGMGTSTLEVALDGRVIYHTDTGFLDGTGVSAAQIGCEIPAQTFTLYADNILAQTP